MKGMWSLLLCLCAAAAPAVTQAADPALDPVEALMREARVTGLALAVIHDGRVAELRAYGLRDVEQALPLTPDTTMYAASLTKGAFAYAVMGISLSVTFLFASPGGVPYSGDTLHFAQHGVLVATVLLVCSTCRIARSHWEACRRAVLVLSLVALPYVVSGWSIWSCHGGGPCLAR